MNIPTAPVSHRARGTQARTTARPARHRPRGAGDRRPAPGDRTEDDGGGPGRHRDPALQDEPSEPTDQPAAQPTVADELGAVPLPTNP